MGEDLINKNDICKSFLVTAMYKVPVGWPHETIAACKIICTDADDETFYRIFRSDEGNHAEAYLVDDATVKKARKINVYMNYSPCSKCADTILEYVRTRNTEFEMTITFANFYKTHEYTYGHGVGKVTGNSRERACANIKGLKKLHRESRVKLQLLGVRVKWEKFLDMSEFFSHTLTEEEKKDCLDKARSKERQRREVQDQMVWGEIFNDWVGVITSGLDSDLLQEIRMDGLSLGN